MGTPTGLEAGPGAYFGAAVTADAVAAFAAALDPHIEGGFAAALRDLARTAQDAGAPMWAMED